MPKKLRQQESSIIDSISTLLRRKQLSCTAVVAPLYFDGGFGVTIPLHLPSFISVLQLTRVSDTHHQRSLKISFYQNGRQEYVIG
jgi:hypothetical protein